MRGSSWLLLILSHAALLACGDDGSSNSGGAGAASSNAGGDQGGAGTGEVDPGSPHTPETGCQEGFVTCGEVCADTATDAAHCGECDNACSAQGAGLTCTDSACVPGDCPGAQCDGECITNRATNADHCGSCFNECASDALCEDGACTSLGGDGSSCASPLFWSLDENESVGFHFAPALTSLHTFPCGPLESIPTRWFRFTAPQAEGDVQLESGGSDDFIIEVFDGSACTEAESIACNDDDSGTDPEIEAPATVVGSTYFIAVGLKGTWSGESATLRVDH